MATDEVKRKLTAIFSADVVGYSRLMREDELATVQTLTSHKETMRKLITHYRGRVVDSIGDNLMAEFASVVDAVQCAVEVQQVLSSKNEELPENRRMLFRIGINLGDVIEEGDRIYGDGVNIAARVESLAEGGGVCISGSAFEQIENKLALGYQYMGEHTVKNIAKPVKVYRVPMGPVEREVKKRAFRGWQKAIAAAVAVLILAGVVAVLWHYYWRPSAPSIEPASMENMAFPLPDKPSIAVLPFANIGGDPDQEYLSDGLTEQIITTLSMVPRLFVIARNSSFTYKGKAVKVQQVAEELGVRYVLEGGVQKAGDKVRITAQLIDALSGRHLWAERYDRDLKDIFALQDEITMKIMSAVGVELTRGEQARVWAKGTDNLEALIKVWQGSEYYFRFNKEGNIQARKFAEEAIALDPEYPSAYSLLGHTHIIDVLLGMSKSPRKSLQEAVELYQKALAIDESHSYASSMLAYAYSCQRQHEKCLAQAERAVALNPNMALPNQHLGGALFRLGRYEESIQSLEKAIRLDPKGSSVPFIWLGEAYCFAGRYEEAIAETRKAIALAPNSALYHVAMAAIYSIAGREEEARAEAAEVLRLNPKFSLEQYGKAMPWRKAELEPWLAALRKAGLPETPPLPLPDKPSIAVLPFVNMSGDPEQEYFSDGISEEIITALSKSSQLFVIARESSFSYKGKQAKVQQISRELGVRYILEGSVRKSEDRVRITAQLIDGIKGQHLWAERYDRDLQDIFALQDEITMKIVTALRIKLTEGEQARMWSKSFKNFDVYLKQMEALSLWRQGTKESIIRYGQLGQEIIDMAPESALGYVVLAWYNWYLARTGKSPRESIGKAFKLAKKALSLDESNASCHALLGSVYLVMRQYEKAIAAGERSVELDPNGAMVHGLMGITLSYADRPDEAIDHLKQGIRLNPFPAYWYYRHLGLCYAQKGQYEEALTEYKKALHRSPDSLITHVSLAGIYILLDRHEEARAAAKKVLEIDPDFSLESALKASPVKNQAFQKLIVDAMHKAGLK